MTDIELFGFQEEFVLGGTSPNRKLEEWANYLYLLAHTGTGGGKSRAGAYRAANYMLLWPGSMGMIAAPTFDMLNDTTFVSLQEVFEEMGLLPERDYEYNATHRKLTVFNGAVALLRSTEHPDRIRGHNLGWWWLDEGAQSPYIAFLNLQARLRQRGYPHQGWVTTTPVGKDHWIHRTWFPEEHDDEGVRPNTFGTYVHMGGSTRDNPHGGEELYQNLIDTYGEDSLRARQELRGEFVLMEGLTWSAWEREVHYKPVREWPVQRFEKVGGAADFGFANPSALLVVGHGKDGADYLLDGYYRARTGEEELAEEALRLQGKWGVQWYACDSASPNYIAAMRRSGVRVMKADKKKGRISDPSYGIGLVAALVAARDPQKLYVDSENPNLKPFAIEIENYINEPDRDDRNPSERPRPKGNHYMDALRYYMMAAKRRWGTSQGLRQVRTEIAG